MAKPYFLKTSLDEKELDEVMREDFELTGKIETRKVHKHETRKDWMHIVTHVFAGSILFIFLFLVVYRMLFYPGEKSFMPDYFISIVSMVVGFYFAKSLFSQSQ